MTATEAPTASDRARALLASVGNDVIAERTTLIETIAQIDAQMLGVKRIYDELAANRADVATALTALGGSAPATTLAPLLTPPTVPTAPVAQEPVAAPVALVPAPTTPAPAATVPATAPAAPVVAAATPAPVAAPTPTTTTPAPARVSILGQVINWFKTYGHMIMNVLVWIILSIVFVGLLLGVFEIFVITQVPWAVDQKGWIRVVIVILALILSTLASVVRHSRRQEATRAAEVAATAPPAPIN